MKIDREGTLQTYCFSYKFVFLIFMLLHSSMISLEIGTWEISQAIILWVLLKKKWVNIQEKFILLPFSSALFMPSKIVASYLNRRIIYISHNRQKKLVKLFRSWFVHKIVIRAWFIQVLEALEKFLY